MNTKFLTKQAGGTLIMSLGLLAVLSLIGFTSMQTSAMEEKLSGNARNRALAFLAAESAIQTGMIWVNSPDQAKVNIITFQDLFQCPENTSSGYYRADSVKCGGNLPAWEQIDQDHAWSTKAIEAQTGLAALGSQPRYIIEGSDLRDSTIEAGIAHTRTYIYKITARGVGGSDKSVVMLQATAVTN